MTIRERFAEKLTSGKFLITITAAMVFAYMSIAGKLPQDKVMEVVLIVIYAYFTKPSQQTKDDNGNSK